MPGIPSLKEQGHFHFEKGTSNRKILKSMGKFWRGTKAKTRDNEGHGFRGLCVILGATDYNVVYNTRVLIVGYTAL